MRVCVYIHVNRHRYALALAAAYLLEEKWPPVCTIAVRAATHADQAGLGASDAKTSGWIGS